MVNCHSLQKQLEQEEETSQRMKDLSLVHESVTDEEIARIISRWTGIPVAKLTESERNKTLASGQMNFTRESLVRMKVLRQVTEAIHSFQSRNQRSDKADWFIPVPWTYRCW